MNEQEDAELRDAIKDRFVAQNIHTLVLQGDLRYGQPCNYEIPFDQFADFIKARDEQLLQASEKFHYELGYKSAVNDLTVGDEQREREIRLHRQEAHLAGRIDEAMSIKEGYTKRIGATSILNGVLYKRLRRYRKQIETVFAEDSTAITNPQEQYKEEE